MSLFDFSSTRTKEDLKTIEDLNIWLKYLYMSENHSIKVSGYTIKMDCDFNLVYIMQSLQDGVWKEDYEHSICANSLTYKELLNITKQLKSDKPTWNAIKMTVAANIK